MHFGAKKGWKSKHTVNVGPVWNLKITLCTARANQSIEFLGFSDIVHSLQKLFAVCNFATYLNVIIR